MLVYGTEKAIILEISKSPELRQTNHQQPLLSRKITTKKQKNKTPKTKPKQNKNTNKQTKKQG